MRPFLDRALGRQTDGIDLLGTERRRVGDEDADIQDLDPFDSLVEGGEDVVVVAGLEHSTSASTGCSAR